MYIYFKKSLISVKDLTFGYNGSINNIFENVLFNIDTDICYILHRLIEY